jgi:predicted RNA-binding protein Jag
MPELDDKEVIPDDAKRITNYLAEALQKMGYAYQIDCHKDGMKVMMGRENPTSEGTPSAQ